MNLTLGNTLTLDSTLTLNTGALIPQLGLGTYKAGPGEGTRNAVLWALEAGYRHIDGAWFYGESPKYHWIDNFHTGYNLDALKRYIESSGDPDFKDHLHRGFSASLFRPLDPVG